ncbi:TetR/AcrR family transcriptional regulator C-terminal domain-containing protein [Nonomuraea sp. NPDC048916]|uniref:TetR/AcrR family transcriptional regulator n=1 Tax=Nonomuraea sp. NPDC048916 TaxID=3154232 RepID=UPI0033F2B8C1
MRGRVGNPDHGGELLWRGSDTEPRPGLSLARIVRAAIEVADAEGLAGLSMRKVADRLGFTTMSLYRHVPGRDQLIDLMRDAVIGERPLIPPVTSSDTTPGTAPPGTNLGPNPGTDPETNPETNPGTDLETAVPATDPRTDSDTTPGTVPGTDTATVPADTATVPGTETATDTATVGWRAMLEAYARESWELRRRHPWLAEVRGSRHLPGPNGIAHYERMLSAVRDTGLTPAEMIAAVGLVGRFLDAEALLLVEAARRQRESGVSEEEWRSSRDSLFERLDRYPTLTYLWEAGGYDPPEDSFEFGLARILDGIELLIHRRDEIRDETCRICGKPVKASVSGRPRKYCSHACRQRAYRQRGPA